MPEGIRKRRLPYCGGESLIGQNLPVALLLQAPTYPRMPLLPQEVARVALVNFASIPGAVPCLTLRAFVNHSVQALQLRNPMSTGVALGVTRLVFSGLPAICEPMNWAVSAFVMVVGTPVAKALVVSKLRHKILRVVAKRLGCILKLLSFFGGS